MSAQQVVEALGSVARPGDEVRHDDRPWLVDRVTFVAGLGLTAVLRDPVDPAVLTIAPLSGLAVVRASSRPVSAPGLRAWAKNFTSSGPRSAPLEHGDLTVAAEVLRATEVRDD